MLARKTCTRCKEEKPITEFNRRKDRPHLEDNPGGFTSMCLECLAQDQRDRYSSSEDYKTKQKAWSKLRHQRLKAAVIEAYGGKCECCGETEPLFLTIDHINGNGGERRKAGEGGGGALYFQLKKRGFPKDNY